MSRYVCLMLSLLFAAGCAGRSPSDDGDSAEEPPTTTKQCYFGVSRVLTPDGRVVGRSDVLVERTFDRVGDRIVETVVSIEEGNPPEKHVVTMHIDGDSFEFMSSDGTFAGSGELRGEAWNWSGFTSKTKFPDGTTIETVDEKTEAGLAVRREVYGPDGSLQVVIEEDLDAISPDRCHARMKESGV